jgi:hypothetical protein
MKTIKGRENAMSAANYERCQVLNQCVIWDGIIDGFEVLRYNGEVHYRKIGAGFLFDTEFL